MWSNHLCPEDMRQSSKTTKFPAMCIKNCFEMIIDSMTWECVARWTISKALVNELLKSFLMENWFCFTSWWHFHGFSRCLLDGCKKHYQGMVLKARYPNRSRYLGAQQADAGSASGYTATEVSNLRIILQPFWMYTSWTQLNVIQFRSRTCAFQQ